VNTTREIMKKSNQPNDAYTDTQRCIYRWNQMASHFLSLDYNNNSARCTKCVSLSYILLHKS